MDWNNNPSIVFGIRSLQDTKLFLSATSVDMFIPITEVNLKVV
jgi:hypothetical protein